MLLSHELQIVQNVCMCVDRRKRERVFVCLILCLCPFVYLQECMCVCVFSSLLLLIHLWDFACLPCLLLLSQSFFSPGPPIHQFTSKTHPTSRPYHHSPRVSGSHIFSPLSSSCSPPFPCSLISPGLRGLFLFIFLPIMSFNLLFALLNLLLYQATLFSSLSLFHICLTHLSLAFSYQSGSVAFLFSASFISVNLFHVSTTISWHLISLCSH